MLAATTHLGSENSEVQMENYIYKKRQDGVNIINLKKTWEKLMLAARAIAAIENPADVFVVSSRPYGQRAVLKFARYIGSTAIAGRYTPGTCFLLDLVPVPPNATLRRFFHNCQGVPKLFDNGEKIEFFVGSIFSNH